MSVLLLLPGVAGAQDVDDPCYVDPTSVECLGVGGADDGEVSADDGEVVADDGEPLDVEVLGEALDRGGAAPAGILGVTGLDAGVFGGLVVVLLTAGSALLVVTRRRRSA
ncbi:hypothetical protein [Nitriliruptor alkaliphilus]|uniref:hypothetical protein n=1 Tax=Nitriliruptor alkaliphilus TaxID=427918 RepID=UPI0012EE7CE9|nr:hypothetical protein [Nitriliruptor alkaliphilus]